MITNLPKEQLVLLGQTVSARRMIGQARYTLGLVSIDPAVKAALDQAFLREAQAALDALETGLRDRFVAATQSKEATKDQDEAVRAGVRARRSLVKRLSQARRRGVPLPEDATRIGPRTRNPGILATDLDRLLSLAFAEAAALEKSGVPRPFLEQAQKAAQSLRLADQRQEVARRALHKDAVTLKRELTGVLFEAVRAITEMGQSVHVDDPPKAAQYSLALLRRAVGAQAPPDPAVSPPSAAA